MLVATIPILPLDSVTINEVLLNMIRFDGP